MKFDINLDVQSASAEAIRYTIKCGQVEVEIYKLMDKESHNYKQRSGGEIGDWLPEYDWRKHYQTKDADRHPGGSQVPDGGYYIQHVNVDGTDCIIYRDGSMGGITCNWGY